MAVSSGRSQARQLKPFGDQCSLFGSELRRSQLAVVEFYLTDRTVHELGRTVGAADEQGATALRGVGEIPCGDRSGHRGASF